VGEIEINNKERAGLHRPLTEPVNGVQLTSVTVVRAVEAVLAKLDVTKPVAALAILRTRRGVLSIVADSVRAARRLLSDQAVNQTVVAGFPIFEVAEPVAARAILGAIRDILSNHSSASVVAAAIEMCVAVDRT